MPQQKHTQLSPWREKLHEIIFEADTRAGIVFDVVLLVAILVSVIIISLESVVVDPTVDPKLTYRDIPLVYGTHWLCTILFTIEYALRVICVRRPLKYIFSFWGIVDLLSFLPEYFLFGSVGGRARPFSALRSLRLLRIFRIFKLNWIQHEAEELGNAVFRSRGKILVFLTVVMIIVTVAGTLMFEVENALTANDENLQSQFKNIPEGIYWAIVTMTTVGFGDIVPVTVAGKIVSAILILVGYSLIIVPTGFVSAEIIDSKRKPTTTISCPTCITEGHDADAIYCKYCGEHL